MKINLRNFLTVSEQKILFFIIFSFTCGLILKFVGFDLPQGNELNAESVKKVLTEEKLQYDLNKVSYEDLIAIPGIGPKKAQAIIDYRSGQSFENVEQLTEIKGIGDKTLLKWKDIFYVEQKGVRIFLIVSVKEDSLSMGNRFNLKTVSKDELMSIPGIGSKKAEAILAYREENGINSIDDLKKVKGIGDKLFLKISQYFNMEKSEKQLPLTLNSNQNSGKSMDLSSQKKDVNLATEGDFCLVKGIGEKKAKDIVDFRDKIGKITSLDQLLEVKGIGPKTLENIKEKFFCGE